MSFAIMTDTSANIPTELAMNKGISVLPLSYHMDGAEFICTDTREFACADYYSMLKSGAKITTSQINPQKYEEVMRPALQDGKDIVFIGMSSGISGSFGSAKIARDVLLEEFPTRKISLIDSMGASLGEGILVLDAIECREQGMTLEETEAFLLQKRLHIAQIFTVDDLMYLRRGGRLSNATAIVGTVLNVKPLLKGNEHGKIVTCGKVRGRKKVIEELAKRYAELVVNPEEQVVCISHGNCPEDVRTLVQLIKNSRPPKDFLIVEHEPVTGSYLGAGSLALYFAGDENVRTR